MKTLLGIAIALTLALIIFKQNFADELLRRKLIVEIEKACVTCKLSVEKVSMTLFPPKMSLIGVHFEDGNPAATALSFTIKRIEIEFESQPILSGVLHLRQVELFSPEFAVVEGDLPSPRSEPGTSTSVQGPKLTIEQTRIKDGKFSYTRVYVGRKAQLFVKDISGTIGALKIAQGFEDLSTRAKVTGRLENSGDFRLTLDWPILAKKLKIDLDLKISEQNLEDISPFFEATGGVKILGSLYFGRGHMEVRGRSIQGSVFAQYRNLSIQMQKTKERNGVMAFLSTLVASVKMDSSSIGEKQLEQTRTIHLEQTTSETTFQLILRGLRDASLQIATNAE